MTTPRSLTDVAFPPGKHVAAKFMFAYQACVRRGGEEKKRGLTHLTFLKKHTPGAGYALIGCRDAQRFE